jgi:prophage regulatory protein
MAIQMLRIREVSARTGLGRSTIYIRIAQGQFPRPIALGSPYAVGWVESEIDGWIDSQIAAARGGSARLTHEAPATEIATGALKRRAPVAQG